MNKIFNNNKVRLAVLLILCVICVWIKNGIKNSGANGIDSVLYEEIKANSYEGDEDFNVYIDKFYRDARFHDIIPVKSREVIVRFSHIDEMKEIVDVHGVSFGMYNDSKIEIYINPSTWAIFSKPMRYLLMYHELAHDVLNSEHIDKKGELMYPHISYYENITMDEFIDMMHSYFDEYSKYNL